MNNYQIFSGENIILKLGEDSILERRILDAKRSINSVWKESLKKNPGLFNGTLPAVISFSQDKNLEVKCSFVEYKQYLAQRKGKIDLGIKPIGVSGIVIARINGEDRYLWGKRGSGVTDYRGAYELVPSGSLDKTCLEEDGKLNYQKKIREEFSEETLLGQSRIKSVEGFAIVYDKISGIYDVCCAIVLKDFPPVPEELSSNEYEELVFLNEAQSEKFMTENEDNFVPVSKGLFKEYLTWSQSKK